MIEDEKQEVDPRQLSLLGPRETSAKAYREISEEGTLGRLQKRVVGAIRRATSPMTANEITAVLKSDDEVNVSYHKRLSELERAGIIKRADSRKCTVTGRTACTWRLA